MNLKEQVKKIHDVMQDTKENWVAENPKNPDLAIYLHFWRGEDMLVGVQCPGDRDIALQAALVGAMGFSADVVTFSFESYFSDLKKSPITGEAWVHLEMQYVFETYPEAAEKGWVSSCLSTAIHDRDGHYGLYSLPYTQRENQVIWGEPVALYEGDEGLKGGGFMYDMLQDAMKRPKASDLLARDKGHLVKLLGQLNLDEEEILFHADVATARELQTKELALAVVFRAKTGTKREELVRDRFGDAGISTFD